MLRQIVDAVSRHHGTVFRRHLLNMISESRKLAEFSNEKLSEFCSHVRRATDGNLSNDVAETFGLAYAAGCFAITQRLLPWQEADLLDALATIYQGARDLCPTMA